MISAERTRLRTFPFQLALLGLKLQADIYGGIAERQIKPRLTHLTRKLVGAPLHRAGAIDASCARGVTAEFAY